MAKCKGCGRDIIWIMDLIDYQMPDAMVEDWQAVCAEYQRIKSEGKQA